MDSQVAGAVDDAEHISLCETLDRVLNKGVVIGGEVVISVADVDLVWLGLQVVLASVETARKIRPASVAWGRPAGLIAHGR